MFRDLQYGLRQARTNKLFSAVVILLLAIGIGSNVLIFSFLDTLLLKPLPVRHPDNLWLLERNAERQVRPETAFSYREYEEISRRHDLISSAVAEQNWNETNLLPFGAPRSARLVTAQVVSPNYFSELGVRAFLGRVLMEEDATAAGRIPVVISYAFWESNFNRNRDVIGQTIRLKNRPFSIAGVLPRDFHSIDIDRAPDIRIPVSAVPVLYGYSVDQVGGEDVITGFAILVRLAPGVTAAGAATAITPGLRSWAEWSIRQDNLHRAKPWPQEDVERNVSEVRVSQLALEPAGHGVSQLRDRFLRALQLLIGAVALLLLAVCANVAGLLFGRAEERRREIALRLAIGAGRGRIMRQLLSENLLLAIPGAALGAVLAFGLSPLLVNLLPAARGFDQYVSPRVLTVTPDLRVLSLTAALCIFCVLVFGILPAIRATRFDLHSELKAGGRAATGSIAGVGPIAVQVALSVVLLATSSLMLRTFWKLEHLNPGFDRPHIVAFTLQPSTAGYSTAQTGVLLRQLDQQVSALPGVRGSGYATRGVMRTIGIMSTVAPQGVVLPRTTFLNTSLNNVSPGYFDAMGIPLLAGRGLEPEDRTKKPSPIVVNRAFADLLFPKQNAVGKFIVQGVDGRKPPTAQIVGIVGSAKYRSMRENPPPTYYELFDEETDNAFVLYVRTFGDPVRIIRSVRSLLFKLDSGLPIMEISTLEQEVQNSLWQERLVAWLAAFFGVVAVVLAALGVYGALAYSVARRSRELGIRVAIGARFQHVIQAVCGRMVWSAGIGLASGVLLSVVMLGITRRLLYGIDPLDPVSLLAAGLIVVSCIAFAAFLPSRRAVHTDPSLVLRIE